MSKKALFLGGTGPTGPLIIEGLFQRGYEVTIYHSGQHEVEYSQPVEHIHNDVHFEEQFREGLRDRTFDLVIAAYGRLKMTATVLAGRCERFISIGGASGAWFDTENRRDATFGRLFGPIDPDPERDRFWYAIYQAEQVVMDHHRAGHYVGTHVRYPLLYGPGQIGSVDWSIVRRIIDGRRKLIIADNGLKLECRLYVDNAAHSVLLALDKPELSAGKVYVVCDEHVLTMRERVNLIAKELNHEFELVNLSYELAKPFHPYMAAAPDHRLIDARKIRCELGYRDVVQAEEAVARTARWFFENRPEPGGELEFQLGDPFDYAAEDRIIEAYSRFKEAVEASGHKDFAIAHPYRHPKKPNEAWQRPTVWRSFRQS